MNAYMTEEEQVEEIKRWWARYGNQVMSLILVVLLAVTGWKWYQGHLESVKAQASLSYEQLIQSVGKSDETGVIAHANYIMQNYPGTVYAEGAGLMLAKIEVSKGQYGNAIKNLRAVSASSNSATIIQLAKLRISRIFLQQKLYSKALSELESVVDNAYLPLVHEVKGDIYFAEKKSKLAEAEYLQAEKALPNLGLMTPELKMKLYQVRSENSTRSNTQVG